MTHNNRQDATLMVDVVPEDEFAERHVEIGPYIVQHEIGRGAMGAVYQAVHTKLKRKVALKWLASGLDVSPRQLARFHREMEAIGRLDHPNIVRATDAGEYNKIHYLVMELISGRDVQQLLSRIGRCAAPVACEIARQTALGLQHIQENQLVHRDIKPSNLLLTDGGIVKILDLGIAVLRQPEGGGGLTIDGTLIGTPDYMAPEQIGGSAVVDIRADIYSLGCTLYTLLVGHTPFHGPEYEPRMAKLIAQSNQKPPALESCVPNVSPELTKVVEKLMAKDVADRYQTPREVADALSPWADEQALQKLAASVALGSTTEADGHAVDLRHERQAERAQPPADTCKIRRSVIVAVAAMGFALLLAVALKDGSIRFPQGASATSPVSKNGGASFVGSSDESGRQQLSRPESPAERGVEQIADSLREVSHDTRYIREDTRQIADTGREITSNTQRIAETLDDLRATFQDAASGGGLRINPRSAGEFYHNARVYQQQGNYALARESYLRLFALGGEFVDVHHQFQRFLILQEGRAGARVVYRGLPGDAHHVVRQYAAALLQDLPQRQEQLDWLVRREPQFAPAIYELSRCSSKSVLGPQTLKDKLTERELLETFLSLHAQGHTLRYFLDHADLATMIDDAQRRLVDLQPLDATLLAEPVSVTISKHNHGWMFVFQIAEVAREIEFRLDAADAFQSTGFSERQDPRLGYRLPKTYATLPASVRKGNIEVRYTDVRGTRRGPFSLVFDPGIETVRDTKRRLEITKSSWVRFGTGSHANRLYFTHLAAHREAIAEVRYAVDAEVPTTVHQLPDPVSGHASGLHVEVSPSARFAVVQVTFRDHDRSEVMRFERHTP